MWPHNGEGGGSSGSSSSSSSQKFDVRGASDEIGLQSGGPGPGDLHGLRSLNGSGQKQLLASDHGGDLRAVVGEGGGGPDPGPAPCPGDLNSLRGLDGSGQKQLPASDHGGDLRAVVDEVGGGPGDLNGLNGLRGLDGSGQKQLLASDHEDDLGAAVGEVGGGLGQDLGGLGFLLATDVISEMAREENESFIQQLLHQASSELNANHCQGQQQQQQQQQQCRSEVAGHYSTSLAPSAPAPAPKPRDCELRTPPTRSPSPQHSQSASSGESEFPEQSEFITKDSDQIGLKRPWQLADKVGAAAVATAVTTTAAPFEDPAEPPAADQTFPDQTFGEDPRYWERRRRNNLAAKKSRDARRVRENQLRVKVICLENANQVLRSQVVLERETIVQLRERIRLLEEVVTVKTKKKT